VCTKRGRVQSSAPSAKPGGAGWLRHDVGAGSFVSAIESSPAFRSLDLRGRGWSFWQNGGSSRLAPALDGQRTECIARDPGWRAPFR